MSDLLSEIRDGVARVTINRPAAMNAMTKQMWIDMADLMRGFESDSAVRCVLITGAGDNFCSGGDVKEFSTTLGMSPDERATFWVESGDRGNLLFKLIERIPQPVVANVRGIAAGGGMALVAAADLAVASETSRYIAAQIRIGAIPDSALSYNLVRNIGPKRAKQFCFLGEMMSAADALDFGLVNRVVPDDELDAATEELVARLAAMPRVALARTKAAMNLAHRISVADHLVQESIDIGACVREEDFVARVQAFVDRARR